jgi:23S rRNA pseudouridine1911/1915/1917 synthase
VSAGPQATGTTVEAGGRTAAAVVRELLDVPWSKAKRLCASGRVWVDGERARDPARRVPAGARVEVDPTAPKERRGVLAAGRVLHVDADVVVVAKPAATLTVPYHASDRDTLADQTRAFLRRSRRGRRGGRDPMVGVVQRLDKDTTGVLVFARNMKAKRALQEQLRAHSVTRRYLAIVHGEAASGRHETAIVQDRGDGLRGSWGTRPQHRGAPPREAKRAVTHVAVKERLRGATLVECRLETGRQHQIRIHLSEAGHPLVGETVYIRDHEGPRLEAPRPMLHALELAFDHPRTKERVRFEQAPPRDFDTVRRRLTPSAGP